MQPVPGLHFAFTTLTWIVNTTKQVQDNKEQIATLTLGLAQLMKTVNEQYEKGKLIERDTKACATQPGEVPSTVIECSTYELH